MKRFWILAALATAMAFPTGSLWAQQPETANDHSAIQPLATSVNATVIPARWYGRRYWNRGYSYRPYGYRYNYNYRPYTYRYNYSYPGYYGYYGSRPYGYYNYGYGRSGVRLGPFGWWW